VLLGGGRGKYFSTAITGLGAVRSSDHTAMKYGALVANVAAPPFVGDERYCD